MLEVFALWTLTKKNGALALEKGRSKGLFIALTIVLWIVNEMIFAIAGALFLDITGYGLGFIALIGGALGGLTSYLIAYFMPASSNANRTAPAPAAANPAALWAEPTAVRCGRCGSTVTLPARFCNTCGAPIENNLG